MLRLSKHHGLGNDFLVRLDGDVDAAMARALCDRRTGVGADGLISVVERRWTLFNGDGSPAEVSGNGLRCAAQAMARAEGVHDLEITFDTVAGVRRVGLRGDSATVDMGPVVVRRLADAEADVDAGNPHLVLRVDDPSSVDLLALGARHPELNVEVIAGGPEPDALTMRVHERGAGITEACGTGSCAAAAAAHAWGMVGPTVMVHNPGGDLTVELNHAAALLTGPTVWVADVEVAWPR
jgi:diaminopimelate epimerase